MKKLQEFIIKGLPLPECDKEDTDIEEKDTKYIYQEAKPAWVNPRGNPDASDFDSYYYHPPKEKTVHSPGVKCAGCGGMINKGGRCIEKDGKYFHAHPCLLQYLKKTGEWDSYHGLSKQQEAEGGPAMGGMGSDNVEPAAEDTITAPDNIQENVELEREAILALRQRDTSLYGMTKIEARQVLKDLGHSDTQIKGYEKYKETKINDHLKEYGEEFPGAKAVEGGNNDDMSLNNSYDGSALGFDNNLNDVSDQMDPNADMQEPLFGVIKPYDTNAEGQPQTSPEERQSYGIQGYKGSIPNYPSMNEGTENGAAGWEKSHEFNDLLPTQNKGEHVCFGDKNVSPEDIDPNSAERQKHMPNKWENGKINVKKLIDKAIARGWSREQIKEMLDSLKKKISRS